MDSENKKLEQAKIVADGISLARRLVNEPANVMTPDNLANEAKNTEKKLVSALKFTTKNRYWI